VEAGRRVVAGRRLAVVDVHDAVTVHVFLGIRDPVLVQIPTADAVDTRRSICAGGAGRSVAAVVAVAGHEAQRYEGEYGDAEFPVPE